MPWQKQRKKYIKANTKEHKIQLKHTIKKIKKKRKKENYKLITTKNL